MDKLLLGPAEVAGMLGISRSSLRALTRTGAIGHVRLGLGTQRQRVGYTPAQLDLFIKARTVPAASRGEPGLGQDALRGTAPAAVRHKPRQSGRYPSSDARTLATDLLQAALTRGDVVEWKAPAQT